MNDALNRGIQTFHQLIRRSWADVAACASAGTYDGQVSDWLQGNWELIVEASLPAGVHLEIYGDGADCNPRSSRVLFPDWIASHRVVCRPRNQVASLEDVLIHTMIDADRPLPFEEFVTMRERWYAREAPFDCVLIDDRGVERVLRLSDVEFELEPVSPEDQ